jgi:hypothetical protein
MPALADKPAPLRNRYCWSTPPRCGPGAISFAAGRYELSDSYQGKHVAVCESMWHVPIKLADARGSGFTRRWPPLNEGTLSVMLDRSFSGLRLLGTVQDVGGLAHELLKVD